MSSLQDVKALLISSCQHMVYSVTYFYIVSVVDQECVSSCVLKNSAWSPHLGARRWCAALPNIRGRLGGRVGSWVGWVGVLFAPFVF